MNWPRQIGDLGVRRRAEDTVDVARVIPFRDPGRRGDFDILSLGKDGQPGGEGEAADISN